MKSRPALLLILIALGVGMCAGLWLPRWTGLLGGPRVYPTATILRQVQTLSQLVTVKYVMEKVEILEDPSTNPLRQMLPDNTRVILIAHGIVKAGVDLDQLKPGDLRVSGRKVEVRLPPAQITDAYLDEKQTQVIEHTTGFLRNFNKDLETASRQNALDDIRRAARNSGILKEAAERAQSQVSHLLQTLGFEEVSFRDH